MQPLEFLGVEAAYDDKSIIGPERGQEVTSAQRLAEHNPQLLTAQLNPAAD